MTADRLAALAPACTPAQALAFFDSLGPVRSTALSGRWRGRELPSGHPLDGRLAAAGWYGKQVDDVDHVHPLLFTAPGGAVFPVDPRRLPVRLAATVPPALLRLGRPALLVVRPALRTRRHRARLRDLEHRGVVSAAMVYDHLPIIDAFRRVDDDTVLGLMDWRQQPQPYFFVLERDRPHPSRD